MDKTVLVHTWHWCGITDEGVQMSPSYFFNGYANVFRYKDLKLMDNLYYIESSEGVHGRFFSYTDAVGEILFLCDPLSISYAPREYRIYYRDQFNKKKYCVSPVTWSQLIK